MSKNIQEPKSRKEHDQMKRDGMNNQKSVSNNKSINRKSVSDNKSINRKSISDNKSIIEKCKKLIRRNNSES
jgi:hypothetical protein